MTTDNRGNGYKVSNYRSRLDFSKNKRKHSASQHHCTAAAAKLMEISLIQQDTSTLPTLVHAHREHNTWADQLTHRDFSGSNESKRFFPDELNWHILDVLTKTHPNHPPPP
jgi:hypothetical protein